MATLAAIALSTLISEDLAAIGAGVLAREGHLRLVPAIAACVAGTYAGDLGLWLAGRTFGRRAGAFLARYRRVDPDRLAALDARLEAHLGKAVLVSRFVPGSRLPLYVAAGIWGRRPLAFAVWSLLAVMAWTPLIVTSAAYLHESVVVGALERLGAGAWGSLLTGTAVLGAVRLAGRGTARVARRYHQRFDQTIETPT